MEKWFSWFKDEKIKTEFVDNGYQYSYEDDYMIETIPLPNGEVFCAVTRRTIAEEKKPVPISDSSGHCKPEDGYEYYVIRKAKGDRFEESSFAKVVSADELIFINESQAVYKDELVFIQNLGDKEKCEKIKNGCNYELRHFGIGKEW